MRITKNGYKIPENPDRGKVFFPALEFNFDRVSAHTHNGADSESLTSKVINRYVLTLVPDQWELIEPGTWQQTVNCPAGLLVSNSALQFTIVGGNFDGTIMYPSVRVVNPTQFVVQVNDPTLTLQVAL
jgi:hypothetical protein